MESLEDRSVPATLNAQYNVELQTHGVSLSGNYYDHLSILITPQNPSLYHDDDNDLHADEDPLFLHRPDGSYALSLGAGPNSILSLVAAFNRDNDIDLHPATQRYTLTKPSGYKDSREWVNALINRLAGYNDSLGYSFLPELSLFGGYNSNSFIAGLLNATGTTIPSPATIFSGREYPGFPTQVPTTQFFTVAPAQRIDLVFVVDTTGSMFDDIDAVKASATQIINNVMTKPEFLVDGNVDARIAVMDYRDFPTDPYGELGDYPFHDDQKFTSNMTTAINGIQSLSLGNGGDLPEAVYSGMMHAIQSPSLGFWRGDGVRKVIIVMGDAPGHDPEPFTGYTAESVITAAENEDPVIVFPIGIGNFDDSQFQAIATGTGGQLIRTTNASTIVNSLLDAINAIAHTPVANAGGPYSGYVGKPINFDASGSYDSDGHLVSYEWDWESDGIYDLTTSGPVATHTWTGTFTGRVRVRVTDNDGLKNFMSADVTVAVNPIPDIEKVQLSFGQTQRSKLLYIQVHFNSLVTIQKGAFQLYLNNKPFEVTGLFTTVVDNKTVATLQFASATLPGLSLPEGQFKLVTRSKYVKNQQGFMMSQDNTDTFFRFFGDVNGDGRVDATDLASFNATYGKRAGQAGYLSYLDFDNNGKIDAVDRKAFNARYGKHV
ncbi:MAG TPA: PKD domain-containing protein [Gemmatales bacterium]|nr:PKD domain-containing protein [Gemmatales bacterium]